MINSLWCWIDRHRSDRTTADERHAEKGMAAEECLKLATHIAFSRMFADHRRVWV